MFLSSTQFEFTRALQGAWQSVRAESQALQPQDWQAWPERALYGVGWDVYGLHVAGRRLLENCIYCPTTTRLLEQHVPGLTHAGFSRLAPGAHIVPHTGYTSDVLRLHLTLQSAGNAALRVGCETRRWIEGECLVFDDTVEHEAWNHGPAARVVLLVDFVKSIAARMRP